MTVLSACAAAAPFIGLAIPTAVYSATDREFLELQTIANLVGGDIMSAFDWQELTTLATHTGDGTTEDFNLPADFNRMVKKMHLYASDRGGFPLSHQTDVDQWLQVTVQGTSPPYGEWIIYGGQIHIRTALANLATAKYYYVSGYYAETSGGAAKAAFTLDTDVFRLNEKTLSLGIIWRWKANHGQPYAEDLANYEISLSQDVGKDKGEKILTVGTRRTRGIATEFAYPGTITP